MARKIKFRAWDKKNLKMWPYADIDSEQTCCDFAYDIEGNSSDADMEEDIVLMQYTGLKDKNGVEIFEGDILKLYDETNKESFEIAEVKWETNGDRGDHYGHILGGLTVECYSSSYGIHNTEREIIGNIYESPELLK